MIIYFTKVHSETMDGWPIFFLLVFGSNAEDVGCQTSDPALQPSSQPTLRKARIVGHPVGGFIDETKGKGWGTGRENSGTSVSDTGM